MKDVSIPSSLVLDLGTCSTKSGWSTSGEPDYAFPTVVGRGRHKGAMKTLGLRDSYVGRQAQNLRGILSLNQPVRNGVIENWDDLETLWSHVWEKEAKLAGGGGNANEEDYRVLVSVPPLSPPEDWRRMGEILLEGAGVGGLYLANKSVLSMYGGGRTTGVCVDTGEDMTYVVPCWEGSPIANATLILKMGGRHVTDRLLSLLSHGKYSFPDDTYLLWKKKGGKNGARAGLAVASRRDVVREAKESFCRVSESRLSFPRAKKSAKEAEEDEQVLRLPDGNIVVVGEEADAAPEVLFQPDLAKRKCQGLHELVRESVMRCDEKLRPRLLSNIMLTGGNSLLPGLGRRLLLELEASLPKPPKGQPAPTVRVQSQEGRENFTWDGGAHLCSLSSFQRLWLTRQDYLETGAVMNVQAGKAYGRDMADVVAESQGDAANDVGGGNN